MKKSIILLLIVAVAACTAVVGTDFSRNRNRWQQAGIQNYSYSLRVVCFCPFVEQMPLHIEVRNGETVSMTYADGTPVETSDPNYDLFSKYATIDKIFADLEANLNGGADVVKASYDLVNGYPTQIDYDFVKEAIDDELYLTIDNFQKLD
jgi:hypothetical protein